MTSDSSDRPPRRTTIPVPTEPLSELDRILDDATIALAAADVRSPTVPAEETSRRSRRSSRRPISPSAASLQQRKEQMLHIVDQLQVLVLRRPHWLDFVEDLLDGLLDGINHDDEDNAAGGAR